MQSALNESCAPSSDFARSFGGDILSSQESTAIRVPSDKTEPVHLEEKEITAWLSETEPRNGSAPVTAGQRQERH